MAEKEKIWREYLSNEAAARELLQKSGYTLPDNLIWQILQVYFDTGIDYSSIFFKRLTALEIADIVAQYLEANGQIIGEVISELDLEFDFDIDRLEKATVKFNGSIWIIHKTDKDPFPSSPHAHEYDKNVKLHLGNGNIYHKKRVVEKMRREQLIQFRAEVVSRIKGVILPDLEV